MLGISRDTLRHYNMVPRIPFVKPGYRTIRYPKSAVLAFIQQHLVRPFNTAGNKAPVVLPSSQDANPKTESTASDEKALGKEKKSLRKKLLSSSKKRSSYSYQDNKRRMERAKKELGLDGGENMT